LRSLRRALTRARHARAARQVWDLADAASAGFLGRGEFKTAMQLVSLAQARTRECMTE
jgi:hypothetical protein